jgi:hypothetical protein
MNKLLIAAIALIFISCKEIKQSETPTANNDSLYRTVQTGGVQVINLSTPKGNFKIKLLPLMPVQPNAPSSLGMQKKDPQDKKKIPEVIYAKYETYENNYTIEYSGGIKQFDIELKSK